MIVRINCDCVGGQIDMIQLSKRVYNGLCLLFGSVVWFQMKMPFDPNKLYASEIMAILLQNSDGKY